MTARNPFEKFQAHMISRYDAPPLRLQEKLRLVGIFRSDDRDRPRSWHEDPALGYRFRPELDEFGAVFEEHTAGPETEFRLQVWCDVGNRHAIEYNTLMSATGRPLQVHVVDELGRRLPYADERRLVAIFRDHLHVAPDARLVQEYGRRSIELDRLCRLKQAVAKSRRRSGFPAETEAWLRQIQQAGVNLDLDLETISERLIEDPSHCECGQCCDAFVT